jgi:hypothetical protein
VTRNCLIIFPKSYESFFIGLKNFSGRYHDAFLRQYVYGAFPIIQFLLATMGFDPAWKQAFVTLIEGFPRVEGVAILDARGFAESWRDLMLWS